VSGKGSEMTFSYPVGIFTHPIWPHGTTARWTIRNIVMASIGTFKAKAPVDFDANPPSVPVRVESAL